MKKIYSSTIAAAMVALLSFTSCDKPVPTPALPSVSPGEITLSVSDITATSAVINAKPANAQGTYHVNVVSKAQYDQLGSDNALIAKEIADLTKLAAMGGKTLVEYLTATLFEGDKSPSFLLDKPETEYYAYAYGLGTDGKATTDVVKKIFASTNAPAEGDAFTISATNITTVGATITIVPKDDKMLYYYELLSEYEYLKYGSGTKEGIAKFLSEYIAEQCEWSEQTPEEYIKQYGKIGVGGHTPSSLSPANKYYVFAVAINASGVVVGEPTIKMFATLDVQPSDITFDIKVTEITSASAYIVVTPSKLTETYFCGAMAADACDAIGDDDELLREIINQAGGNSGIREQLSKGVVKYRVKLAPNTEYYVLTFGYSDSPTTKLTKSKFKTDPEVVDPTTTFTFNVTLGAREATVEVVPSNKEVLYIWDVVPATQYTDVKACLQATYDYFAKDDPKDTPDKVVAKIGVLDDDSYKWTTMSPNTDYYIWVTCVKMDGTMVGSGASQMFTTKDEAASLATVTIAFAKFYDGDALNAADPATYKDNVKGKAVIPVTITPSPAAVRWHSAMFSGDLTNPAEVSDNQIIKAVGLVNQGLKAYNAVLPWDTQVTFLGYAVDATGGIGLAARKTGNFDRTKVSPISDMIGEKAPKANASYTNMLISKYIDQSMSREKYTGMKNKVSAESKDAATLNSTELRVMEFGAKAPVASERAIPGHRKF